MIFRKFVVLVGFLLAGLHLPAQTNPKKPEAVLCTRERSGKYQVELAGCHSYMDIDVLDLSGKPLKQTSISGTAEYVYLDETTLITNFRQFLRTNTLRAPIPAPGFYRCHVRLTIGNDTVDVCFDNECDLRN